jgi:hypothetical protein
LALFKRNKEPKQSTDQQQYSTIIAEFNAAKSAMAQFHSDWREFDEFYLSNQWSERRASWRPDPVINYASYIVDQKKPQLTNNRPTGIILPVAQGDEDAAKLFTQVTDVIADRCDLDSTIDEIVQTGLTLDIAWFYVRWDNSLSGGSAARKNVWKGDVVVECVDPANIYIDPQATDIDAARYVIYAVPKTVQWVREQFGVDVEPDAAQTFETEIYNRPDANQGKDRVMFYARWTRVDGKLNVTYAAGGKVIKSIDGVYKHGNYPFIPFVAKKRRKSIVGISEIRNIINNQKLLNKLVEMPTTSALLTANPIALISRKSGVSKDKWVSKPGQAWDVNGDPREAVHWLQPPNFSGDVYKLADMMVGYIERIGGVYDSMTGETPKGVTAASAIQLLQEQGSIPIKGIARNLYAALKDVYKQMIQLVQEFYTETRYIRITGEDGGNEFIAFNGAEYAEVDFDIKVSAGAATPMSRAYISQLAEDLFAKELLLGSEYVEMMEGLPNKERIVARLRELESQPPPQPQGAMPTGPGAMPQQGMVPQQQAMPTVDDIYAQAPPQLQQEIDLLREQGTPDDQIMQMLMGLLNQ